MSITYSTIDNVPDLSPTVTTSVYFSVDKREWKVGVGVTNGWGVNHVDVISQDTVKLV